MFSSILSTVYNPDTKIWLGTTNAPILDNTVSYAQMLLRKLEKYPDVVIQINHDTGNKMTCKEMLLKAKKVAENLIKLNIQIGDFVVIATEHYENLVPVYLGILAIGAVVNPLHSGFTILEFNYFLDIVKPKLIICNGNITDTITKSLNTINHSSLIYTFLQSNDPSIKLVDELFNEFDTNPAKYEPPNLGDLSKALAFILCSSGTTGPPKAVLVSHGMALYGLVLNGINDKGVTTFNTSHLHWLTSITNIATSIVCHSPRVITAQPITEHLLLEVLEKNQVRNLFTSPRYIIEIVSGLENGTWDLSNLKLILAGGAILTEKLITSLKKLLPNVVIMSRYGLTEAGGGVSCRLNMNKMKSVGLLAPGTMVKIISKDGNEHSLGHNEIGEICVKKIFPFLGYLKNKKATRNTYDSYGWLHTGDMGYFDEDNELFFIYRKKDIFKYRGFHVSPTELESFIQKSFDGVKEVVVVGIPDERAMSLVAAAVVLHKNAQVTEHDICITIEQNFSDSNKLRGGVYFFNDLPRTRTGKFIRYLILDTVWDLYNKKNKNYS